MFNNKFKVGEEVFVKGVVIGINSRKRHGEKEATTNYSIGGMKNKDGDTMFNCIEAIEDDIKEPASIIE